MGVREAAGEREPKVDAHVLYNRWKREWESIDRGTVCGRKSCFKEIRKDRF